MNRASHDRAMILIFAKVPVAGRVKTRLMPRLTGAEAAALHRACLEDVLRTVAGLPSRFEKRILFAGPPTTVRQLKRTLVPRNISVGLQARGNLGRRLLAGLRPLFRSGISRVVVIGTDTPWLSRRRILGALRMLARNDVVFGPTKDGGYYLIACRRSIPKMFSNIAWGTDRVMEQTKRRLRSLGLRCHLLPLDFDLDRPEDLERSWRMLALARSRGERPAPALSRMLAQLRQTPSRSSRPR